MGAHPTDSQEAALQQHANTLQRRIDSWVKFQYLYMPALASLRSERSQNGDNQLPERFDLMLPSRVASSVPCSEHLRTIEWQLRYAQAHESLRSLRSNLRARSFVLKYKDRNLRGQGANTRARNVLKSIESRIDSAFRRYEVTHQALVALAPQVGPVGWQSILRPLERNDVRSMTDLLWGESEGNKKLSWIWTVSGAADEEDISQAALEGRYSS